MTAGGPPERPPQSPGPALLKRLAIWSAFVAFVYLTRDFFFLAFMTFMFSYSALAVVGWAMRRFAPGREAPGLRWLLTAAVFLAAPVALFGLGLLVVPRLFAQGQRLAGWLSHADPEAEVARLIEGYVGPSEFAARYGGPNDARYAKGLEEFRKSGARHVEAYNQFPKLEAWMEGGFGREFADAERGRIRARLAAEGPSAPAFERWFLTVKVPELKAQALKPDGRIDPLVRAAASASPEDLLRRVQREPAELAVLRRQWIDEALERELTTAKSTAAYRDELRRYVDERHAQSPAAVPYTFDEYVALQTARSLGPVAFGEAFDKLRPPVHAETEAQVRADFEAAKRHELFEAWWGDSSSAKFVRRQVEAGVGNRAVGKLEGVLSSMLDVPVALASALVLSFFICIDFETLRRACRRLRDTWLRDAYDELAPALTSLATLIGKAMQAQSLIALCNASMLFLAMTALGIDHAVLLAGAAFVLCLVPTIGAILTSVVLIVAALVQPGGGLALALKMAAVVAGVVLFESLVLSPRILGKMMELHPVLIFAILPLAQYFFGVWGLILGTPVTVYVIHDVILRSGLPGIDRDPVDAAAG